MLNVPSPPEVLTNPLEVKLASLAMVGVVKVGLVPNTKTPEPVSLEMTPANWALVVEAKTERLLLVTAMVLSASGSVNVFSLVAGPVNLVKPLPVPPLEEPRMPDTSAVKETAE